MAFSPISLERTVDPDVTAYLSASGLTGSANQAAINTLIGGLKYFGLWSKMNAAWPFVGGTAALHKWNLKDPRDLDSAFRLTFSGTITHNTNGITGNGVDGWADTKLTPSVTLIQDSAHLSVYCRNSLNPASGAAIGSISNSQTRRTAISPRISGVAYFGCNSAALWDSLAVPSSQGLFATSRTGPTSVSCWRNSKKIIAGTTASTTPPTATVGICALNDNGTATSFVSANIAFASVGSGLTDTDMGNLNRVVQNYQSILGRVSS